MVYTPQRGFAQSQYYDQQATALAGMLAKHIVSLYDMCFDNDTDYGISSWYEKITGSLNYLFLLKAIVKEGHPDQTD